MGFVMILLFGFILATAGFVTSAIFNDALVRFRLEVLTKPLASCIIWGTWYYGWMALIAYITLRWKHSRLDDDSFGMRDGYW
jgi:hypothetical protein